VFQSENKTEDSNLSDDDKGNSILFLQAFDFFSINTYTAWHEGYREGEFNKKGITKPSAICSLRNYLDHSIAVSPEVRTLIGLVKNA
jgi:hypothetical protein